MLLLWTFRVEAQPGGTPSGPDGNPPQEPPAAAGSPEGSEDEQRDTGDWRSGQGSTSYEHRRPRCHRRGGEEDGKVSPKCYLH
jgi:hypothetical protein